MIRKIIRIDKEKCNGCGACADACHEGAIDIIHGKAELVREHFCDGLGDCLPECPTGAISFEEREAPEYDEKAVKEADLVIGCVLIPGKSAPKIFKKKYLKEMKPGAVFVDVAVDQGGCGETTKVTYHDDPIFIEDGVVHYCVGNMPGAVPRTSTIALTNATLSYGLQIAGKGLEQACKDNEVIYSAINTYDGKLTCKNVADSFDCYEYTDIKSVC